MKVTGKIVFLALVWIVASLLCGTYVKGSPALFEPKFEQTTKEASPEIKVGDRKELQRSLLFDFDDDFFGTTGHRTSSHYLFSVTLGSNFRIEKHARVVIPRYLLFCSLRLHTC